VSSERGQRLGGQGTSHVASVRSHLSGYLFLASASEGVATKYAESKWEKQTNDSPVDIAHLVM
jgi:hypothetical protein